MDISGLVQSYDARASSSAALSRTIMAPQYGPALTFSGASTYSMVATPQQLQHHNPSSFGGYSGPNNVIIPAFANNFIQQRPLPRMMQPDDDGSRTVSFTRPSRPGYIEDHHSQSPPIKSEPMWATSPSAPAFDSKAIKMPSTSAQTPDTNFGTEVDTLMKAIQAKSQTTQPQTTSSAEQIRPVVGASHAPPSRQTASHVGVYASGEETLSTLTQWDLQEESSNPRGIKKRYECTIPDCNKSFYQKTHLDIHERAHTGVKPYPCKEPGCGRSFSQLGNLRTHERRHTGERPYQCDICGKRFAQRGNVRAHKIVHDQFKPYLCRLDDCGKQFTQLGNLKSHQNKFHVDTIRQLTAKYTSAQDGDIFNAAEKELWEYFANLYKNSNKGIKGRGKDRKVGSNGMTSMRSLGVSGSGRGFGLSGSGRGHMVMDISSISGGDGSYEPKYEIFDADDESQSGGSQRHSASAGPSSVGTCYEDATSDGFEDAGRGSHELAFGDRIY